MEDTQEAAAPVDEPCIDLVAKFDGQDHHITIPVSKTVGDLKVFLSFSTNVLPQRQKLLGLVKGKILPDQMVLATLNLKQGTKFILVGTPGESVYSRDLF